MTTGEMGRGYFRRGERRGNTRNVSPSSGGVAALRASAAVLSCHLGIALLSSYLRSRSHNTVLKTPEFVSPVKIFFFSYLNGAFH